MKEYELKHIDPEDLGDVLVKVETSFNIQFIENELAGVKTFGELCDCIADKIRLEPSDDCTSQQAFYKIREAFSSTLHIDKKRITPHTSLAELFPRQSRRSAINQLEKNLGFKLGILRAPHWVTMTLVIIFLASIFTYFFSGQIGVIGIVASLAGSYFSNLTGNELNIETTGELAEKISREHYLESRRNPQSFNRKEIEKVVTDLFSTELGLDQAELTREAEF